MPVPYNKFHYLTNPRTEVRPSGPSLPRFEIRGWWAQIKRNGSRAGTYVPPDRQPFVDVNGRKLTAAWNRHGEPRASWQFDRESWEPFGSLKGDKWCHFDGELLDQQTKHIKDVHYLYDILVWNGVHLTGTTYAERYKILLEVWPIAREEFGHYVINDGLWIARNYTENLLDLYTGLSAVEDEGLVLKDPAGIYRSPKADEWMANMLRPNIKK